MKVSLLNKVIVITGSTKGIGRAFAEAFIKEDANLVINYHEDDKEAEKMYDMDIFQNGKSLIVKADICNENDMHKLRDEVFQRYGRIDVLINNVGIVDDDSIMDMSLKQWERVITTNLTGTFLCSKCMITKMVEQRYGKIINIASLKGVTGSASQVNYASSKAGVIGMTRSLAKELGKYNIAVNALCPGYIETDLNRNVEQKKLQAQHSSVLDISSCMDDLVSFVMLLCSNQVMGVSGQVFHIDSRIL